ncbi:hypothetical protein AOQ73_05205 [Bradyrhizobium pachyrhizi]|nr:hypothetical protein AOQ73_05205 [Bradyrhizobium pachyrhizi]
MEDIALPAVQVADRLQGVRAIPVDRLQGALAARSPAIPATAEATIGRAGVMVLPPSALQPQPARMAPMATTATKAATTMNTGKWSARSIDPAELQWMDVRLHRTGSLSSFGQASACPC